MISTELRTALSTETYPIRHTMANVTPNINDRDSDLETWGDPNAQVLVTGASDREFPSVSEDFDPTALIGRIVAVRPSRPHGEQWFLRESDNPLGTGGAYVNGARINPEPVNGRVYQEIRTEGGGHANSPFLLRFNDDDHSGDRVNVRNPWTIVWAQDGLEHQVDRPRITPPTAWVEVQWPLTPVTTGLATDADIDEIFVDWSAPVVPAPAVPAPMVGYYDNAVVDHTHGKAQAETEGAHAGHVLADPPRVEGEMYLTWYTDATYYDDHVFVQIATADNGLLPIGYYNRGMDGGVYFTDDVYSNAPTPRFSTTATLHWAKLALEVPAPAEDAQVRYEALVEEASTSHDAFENLNDALNELARSQQWCSEYERTMEGIGMRHRRSGNRVPFDIENVGTLVANERHAWDIQYDVEVSVSDDSLSYRVSNMLESEYGLSSVSEVRFDASLTVTICGVVAETEEEAENMVTQGQIESEVESIIEGNVEINDYSHSDTSEDTDFDWDNYDD